VAFSNMGRKPAHSMMEEDNPEEKGKKTTTCLPDPTLQDDALFILLIWEAHYNFAPTYLTAENSGKGKGI
jgi:hypothetical protein